MSLQVYASAEAAQNGEGCRRLHALVELLVRAQLLQGLRYFSISIGPSCSVIDVKKARSSNRWSL
jgi:hypothetical protein